MEWTDEDRAKLLQFKSIIDFDDIRVKEIIKSLLLDNKYIIHVLNNKELEDAEAEADEYFGKCILPYYLINPSQHNTQNFICYEINYDEVERYNSCVKKLEIVFHVLCHNYNNIDNETGIARHDLLAALIQDQFNYTNYFGNKIILISDVGGVVDNDYACRTLIFQQRTDNNLVKTRNSQPLLANKINFLEE